MADMDIFAVNSFELKRSKLDHRIDHGPHPSHHLDSPITPYMYPKTHAEMRFSTLTGQFSLDHLRLSEIVRFKLFSYLSIDLGFLIFTRGNLSLTDIQPRLCFPNLTADCGLELLFGRQTQGLGFSHKSYLNSSISVFMGRTYGHPFLEASSKTQFKYFTATTKINTYKAISAKLHKSTDYGSISLYGLLKNKTSHFIGSSIKLCVLHDTKFCAGVELQSHQPQQVSLCKLGVELSLGKHTKLSYNFEKRVSHSVFRVALKKGGLRLYLPVVIKNIPVLIGCVIVIGCSILTKRIAEKLVGRQEEDVQEGSGGQKCQEFVEMVRERVEAAIEKEDRNGGLVVVKGFYGRRDKIERVLEGEEVEGVLDVKIPLNFMVEKESLKIPAISKAHLQGFYHVDNPSVLYIEYKLNHMLRDPIFLDDLSALEINYNN